MNDPDLERKDEQPMPEDDKGWRSPMKDESEGHGWRSPADEEDKPDEDKDRKMEMEPEKGDAHP